MRRVRGHDPKEKGKWKLFQILPRSTGYNKGISREIVFNAEVMTEVL